MVTDELLHADKPDLATRLTTQFPSAVVAHLFDMDEETAKTLYPLTNGLFNFAIDPGEGIRSSRALRRLCNAAILKARTEPGRDRAGVLSVLLAGTSLDDETTLALFMLLIGAATKTTSDVLGTLMASVLRMGLYTSVGNDTSTPTES